MLSNVDLKYQVYIRSYFLLAASFCASNSFSQSIDLMALGDSAWIESKSKFKDKDARDIHPGLENIIPLKAKDINFINLEAAVTTGCKRFASKPFSFAVGEKALLAFASWGFNLFALANNHSIDCTKPPVNETVDKTFNLTKRYFKNVAYHGVAANKNELLKPAILNVKGMKIGMVSIKNWNDRKRPYLGNHLNHQKLFKSLQEANVDFRILSIHGGVERSRIPDPDLVNVSRSFITSYNGDLVIGHHPHVVSGFEYIKKGDSRNALIVYSLGNGLHNGINGINGDGKVLKLKLSKEEGVIDPSFYPLRSNSFKISSAPLKRLEYFKSHILSSSSLTVPWTDKISVPVNFKVDDTEIPFPGFVIKEIPKTQNFF